MFITTDVFLIRFVMANSKPVSKFGKRRKLLLQHCFVISVSFTYYIKQPVSGGLFVVLLIICLDSFKCIPNFFCCHTDFCFFIKLKRLLNKFAKLGIIQRSLHGLDEPYKEVFMWRTLGELSFKQIGALFGKTENWACVTYHRARKKIQEGMEVFNNEK